MPSTESFFDTVQIMDKGQITLPDDVLKVIGVAAGGRVAFVVEDGSVRLVNPAVYAMDKLRKEMAGAAEKAGITSDDDVVALVKEIRASKE